MIIKYFFLKKLLVEVLRTKNASRLQDILDETKTHPSHKLKCLNGFSIFEKVLLNPDSGNMIKICCRNGSEFFQVMKFLINFQILVLNSIFKEKLRWDLSTWLCRQISFLCELGSVGKVFRKSRDRWIIESESLFRDRERERRCRGQQLPHPPDQSADENKSWRNHENDQVYVEHRLQPEHAKHKLGISFLCVGFKVWRIKRARLFLHW